MCVRSDSLIFLGSEKYPYVDGLSQIVARNLAAGSNAWTATDHTAYTISTAGSEGFLQILPVYMDNILYPTLSHSTYVTEVRETTVACFLSSLNVSQQVYHVNGEGSEGGVVFCEMQGRENLPADLMFFGFVNNTSGLLSSFMPIPVPRV
jgi:Zn-dependent M16 (insulinase) family peptidase